MYTTQDRKEGGKENSPVMLVVKKHAFLKEIQVGFVLCFTGAVLFGAYMLTRLFFLEEKL